jgi:hypothetical protein
LIGGSTEVVSGIKQKALMKAHVLSSDGI